jgi:hypothetical protein
MTLLPALILMFSVTADTSTSYLPKGTIIKLHLTQPVSSETARLAEPVAFEVAEDVKVGTVVVIPRGSKARGYISTAISGRLWGYGRIGVYVGSVEAASGFSIPVQGTIERGGNKEALIASETDIFAATELELPLDSLVAANYKDLN